MEKCDLIAWIVNYYEDELDGYDQNPVHNHKQDYQKHNKPLNIILPDAIIDPRTVMIVLFNADVANIAVIGANGLVLNASQAYGLDLSWEVDHAEGWIVVADDGAVGVLGLFFEVFENYRGVFASFETVWLHN